MNGAVTVLECFVLRRDARRVQQLIAKIDPQAFITSQAVRPLQRGFWPREDLPPRLRNNHDSPARTSRRER